MSTTLSWNTNSKTQQWTTTEGIPDASTGGTDTWGTAITVYKIDVGSTSNSITLPATISRTADVQLEVTEHAIETQAQVTDHVIQKPNKYALTAYLANLWTDPLTGVGTAENTFQQLQQLAIAGTLFTVANPSFSETNLLIETIRAEKIPEEANLLKIDISFKKIRYVDTLQVELQTAGMTRHNFKAKTKEAATEEQDKLRSFLYSKSSNLAGGDEAFDAKIRRFGIAQ